MGADGMDTGTGIALDKDGGIYVTGNAALNFPTTPGAVSISRGATSTFIAKFEIEPGLLPRIINAAISGKKLMITGENFADGAVLLIDGNPLTATADNQNPATLLKVNKKKIKNVAPGQTVTLQIQNPDGMLSPEFSFTRPL
jgi:hypothetical protein